MNKVPIVKFLSYLTSHIYFMLFLSLTCVAPPHTTIRESLLPHWYEIVTVTWYAGQLLAEFTNPGTRWAGHDVRRVFILLVRGGFSWVKSLNVLCGVCAVCVHIW